jgi:hypothetical protein
LEFKYPLKEMEESQVIGICRDNNSRGAAQMIRGMRRGLVIFGFLAIACGCSRDMTSTEVSAKNNSHIKQVVNLYSGFQMSHGWQGPKDIDSFKNYIKTGLPPQNLQMMGVDPDHLDLLFTSQNDNKPFKIRYGISGGLGVVDALVFEEQGTGGKRQVGFNGPYVEAVDEARYKDLWEHGGHPQGLAVKNGIPGAPPDAAPK